MKAADRMGWRIAVLAGLALALAAGLAAQNPADRAPATARANTTQPAQPAQGDAAEWRVSAQNPQTSTSPRGSDANRRQRRPAQPAPGTTPVGGDQPAPAKQPDSETARSGNRDCQQRATASLPGETEDKKDKKKDKDKDDNKD